MSDFPKDLDALGVDFCKSNRISPHEWVGAKIEWRELRSIGDDHEQQIKSLSQSASMYASLIQSIHGVHSVRWRVKSADHLMAKIVRKRNEQKEGYTDISGDNYFDRVTDLVGIRALHLFKGDFAQIHEFLDPFFQNKEDPVANLREGDPDEWTEHYKSLGLQVRFHPEGYRSIHYVKTVKPIKRKLHLEIQVRTVFEEGWSEVDHRIRYPNFSKDHLVAHASAILNRLSGMADEMSTYALQLSNSLSKSAQETEVIRSELDEALAQIDKLSLELGGVKQSAEEKQDTIDRLKHEVSRMRQALVREPTYNALAGLGARPDAMGLSASDLLSGAKSRNSLAEVRSEPSSLGVFNTFAGKQGPKE
ncbi:COG2357 PpGpp synthetase catalytic domain [Paracoccaceae bacterium]